MSELITMCLWIHGTAGNPSEPCGEVDVIEFTGEKIRIEFIESVVKQAGNGDLLDFLKGLPTEKWLDVDVKATVEPDDPVWGLTVFGYRKTNGG